MKPVSAVLVPVALVFAMVPVLMYLRVSPQPARTATTMSNPAENKQSQLPKSEEEWKKKLTPEQYHVLREKGTERAFTGKYWDHKGVGHYACAGCGEVLFTNKTKFDSGCGWPSFWDAADKKKIVETLDLSHGMRRIEVTCAKCGGHLGHVFPDGPNPTGMRYCINSASIEFKEQKDDNPSK